MCGRYYVDDDTAKEIEKILRQIDKRIHAKEVSRDVFPSQSTTIIYNHENKLSADQMIWGIPNHNHKGILINARSESVLEKRMFMDGVKKRRCVIPAKGFYEWDHAKNKVSFERYDNKVLYMAGFWNQYEGDCRFVILTTKANQSVASVHDRMPIVIEDEDMERWMFDLEFYQKILKEVPQPLKKSGEFIQQTLPFV